jgi:hypothetical protein
MMAMEPPRARQLPDWIVDHMRKYVETNGADGHIWNGVPTLLLTTTGRRSGKSLMLPLIYGFVESDGKNLARLQRLSDKNDAANSARPIGTRLIDSR